MRLQVWFQQPRCGQCGSFHRLPPTPEGPGRASNKPCKSSTSLSASAHGPVYGSFAARGERGDGPARTMSPTVNITGLTIPPRQRWGLAYCGLSSICMPLGPLGCPPRGPKQNHYPTPGHQHTMAHALQLLQAPGTQHTHPLRALKPPEASPAHANLSTTAAMRPVLLPCTHRVSNAMHMMCLVRPVVYR